MRRLPVGVDHAAAAGAVISGLTAWQALFDHARLRAGQTVLIHGAAGSVGSIAVQLARQVGSRVIGTGRAADRDRALGLGVDQFVDLDTDRLEDVVEADRSQLAELAQRLRDGRLTSNVGAVRALAEVPAAFGPDAPRGSGKTIIQVTEGW